MLRTSEFCYYRMSCGFVDSIKPFCNRNSAFIMECPIFRRSCKFLTCGTPSLPQTQSLGRGTPRNWSEIGSVLSNEMGATLICKENNGFSLPHVQVRSCNSCGACSTAWTSQLFDESMSICRAASKIYCSIVFAIWHL